MAAVERLDDEQWACALKRVRALPALYRAALTCKRLASLVSQRNDLWRVWYARCFSPATVRDTGVSLLARVPTSHQPAAVRRWHACELDQDGVCRTAAHYRDVVVKPPPNYRNCRARFVRRLRDACAHMPYLRWARRDEERLATARRDVEKLRREIEALERRRARVDAFRRTFDAAAEACGGGGGEDEHDALFCVTRTTTTTSHQRRMPRTTAADRQGVKRKAPDAAAAVGTGESAIRFEWTTQPGRALDMPLSHAQRCLTLREMLADVSEANAANGDVEGSSNVITDLPLDADVMERVAEYARLEHEHVDADRLRALRDNEERLLLGRDQDDASRLEPRRFSFDRPWQVDFVARLDGIQLQRLTMASNFLSYAALFELCTTRLGDMLERMTTEEMRDYLGLPDDMTPEEKKEAAAGLGWLQGVGEQQQQEAGEPTPWLVRPDEVAAGTIHAPALVNLPLDYYDGIAAMHVA